MLSVKTIPGHKQQLNILNYTTTTKEIISITAVITAGYAVFLGVCRVIVIFAG